MCPEKGQGKNGAARQRQGYSREVGVKSALPVAEGKHQDRERQRG